MLPVMYELPGAIVLILAGTLACFAGYRLFRIVLGIYGFILGAMLASSVMGMSNVAGMVGAAIVGGLIGALLMVFAYYVGIGVLGAGLAALAANVAWTRFAATDPPAVAVAVASVAGAGGAMVLQRYVMIAGTAFAGAWTIFLGALTLMGARPAPRGSSDAAVWILYPLGPSLGGRWVVATWVLLGLLGTFVQLRLRLRPRKRKPRRDGS